MLQQILTKKKFAVGLVHKKVESQYLGNFFINIIKDAIIHSLFAKVRLDIL